MNISKEIAGDRRYRIKYSVFPRFGELNYQYEVIGAKGAVHLHLSQYKDGHWTGGVEYHHRTPPEHMADLPPSHADCPFLNSNCWHDGSSLYAIEHYAPMHRDGDTDAIFRNLLVDYRRTIEPSEEKSGE